MRGRAHRPRTDCDHGTGENAVRYGQLRWGRAPTRPLGRPKGGDIWLHMDHGSGTSACVSVSESAMRYLLRTLDPRQHPVVVMGDRTELNA
ncbi:hypothetical protein SY2F82_08830 [Streptomyces sp. Y2F8-2]|nr:hypothetical protein SY2F82_08830 [Streptomyces sp. Y2F8-2]